MSGLNPYSAAPPQNEEEYQETYEHFEDLAADILISNSLQLMQQEGQDEVPSSIETSHEVARPQQGESQADMGDASSTGIRTYLSETANEFKNALVHADRFDQTYEQNPGLYEWEELLLSEASDQEWRTLVKSCAFGMGCGLLSFSFLRGMRAFRGSAGLGRRTGVNSSTHGGYRFDQLPGESSQSLHNRTVIKSSRPWLFLDVTLSSFVGIGASLYSLEYGFPRSLNGDDASTAPPPPWVSPHMPLVPGRSIIADELCQPLTAEFRKFPREMWQPHLALYSNGGWKDTKYYNENENASVVSLSEYHSGKSKAHSSNGSHDKGRMYEQLVMDNLLGFIINCERRARYEKHLRKVGGMQDDFPVVVPSAGVPADEMLELDDIYYAEEDRNGYQ